MKLPHKSTKQFVIDRQKRNSDKKACEQLLAKYGKKPAKKGVNDFYYECDIEKNTVLINGLGTNVRGSMQYVLNVLNHSDDFEGYKIYVRTKDHTDDIVKGYIKQNHWDRTETVPTGYSKKLETCQYLLTESYFPYAWVKKDGQMLVDIWHGTPLKKIGIVKNGKKRHNQPKQQKNFIYSEYLLYPNEYTRDIMWESFGVTHLQRGKALMLGYPRTSGLLDVSEERKQALLQTLAPNGEKIYAYMPTFRGYLSDKETVERETALLNALDQRLQEDQILYVNLHHHIGAALDCDAFAHIRKFPPLVDSYELLSVTDALISDYSSVFFDYLALRKQIILYIEDYDTYCQYQGLNMDIRDLPFDMAKSPEDIISMLQRGKTYDDTEVFNSLCAYDSPQNAEKLCQLFRGSEEGLVLQEIPGSQTPKILFYTDCCHSKKARDVMDQLVQKPQDRYELFVGAEEKKTNANVDEAYPMLFHANVFCYVDDTGLSSVAAPLLKLYQDGKLPFKKVIGMLEHEYALMPIRMYGNKVFETVAIYDTLNPEMVLALALSAAKNRLLFLSDEMIAEMAENTFFRDAVAHAASYCHLVIVSSREDAAKIKSRLHFRDRGKIITAGSAEEILEILDELHR